MIRYANITFCDLNMYHTDLIYGTYNRKYYKIDEIIQHMYHSKIMPGEHIILKIRVCDILARSVYNSGFIGIMYNVNENNIYSGCDIMIDNKYKQQFNDTVDDAMRKLINEV